MVGWLVVEGDEKKCSIFCRMWNCEKKVEKERKRKT